MTTRDTLTPRQIQLVQDTWAKVLPTADAAAEMFYSKLFSLDPTLSVLFIGDMKSQGRKFMAMIDMAVKGLATLGEIIPAAQDLGRRHASYGVLPADYRTVATALLWALEQGLGDAYTPEVKGAWVAAYGLLAQTLQDAGPAMV